MNDVWKAFAEYGLAGLLSCAMVGLLFLIVKWTLCTTKDILTQAAKEREAWHSAFSAHTAQAKEFHSQVSEAHKYQREEHKEQVEIAHEIVKTLGRINGYKEGHK